MNEWQIQLTPSLQTEMLRVEPGEPLCVTVAVVNTAGGIIVLDVVRPEEENDE